MNERRYSRARIVVLTLIAVAEATGALGSAPATQPALGARAEQNTFSGRAGCACLTDIDRGLLTDFGGLTHYRAADSALPRPAPAEKRVVFIGDSITESWKIEGPGGTFPGKPYINRGIGGQTTPQMLVRFRQDVIELQPRVVVIMAGTNDIAGNIGPLPLEQTEGDLASMADLATEHGIRVVLCSVTPAIDYPWNRGLNPAPKIVALNAWILDYATRKNYVYVDYYSALKDKRGGLPPSFSNDGVHPLPAGFAIMAPLAEAGIEKALAR